MLYLYHESSIYDWIFVWFCVNKYFSNRLNLVNSHFTDSWGNEFAVASAVFSGLVIGWSVFKFMFYVGVMNMDMTQFML